MNSTSSEPSCQPAGCGHAHTGLPGLAWLSGPRVELSFAVASVITLLLGWGLSFGDGLWLKGSFVVLATSYFFGGFFATVESIHALRHGKLEIDFLMIVAAIGAGLLNAWAEGALLLALFSTGHALEHYALGRARKSIASLGKLRPKTALRVDDSVEQEVPIESLQVGDVIRIYPDSVVAADGVIVSGESDVDQAAITGESVPVEKSPAPYFQAGGPTANIPASHRVFAGTTNGVGSLRVVVTSQSDDTTLSRMMRLVTEAESQRSPTQRLTSRFEKYYVPAILILVVLMLSVPPLFNLEPFAASFYRAMAVLVAASPCALAIATPSAVLSAVSRAGQGGLLFKGGGPLESLGAVRAVAFDKTGTLTHGKPKVTDICPFDSMSEDALLATAAAVERLSPHPLARAVWLHACDTLGADSIDQATRFRSITGGGVEAEVDGQTVSIGNESLLAESQSQIPDQVAQQAAELRANGRTVMIVRQNDRYLGLLGLQDTPRESAADAIRVLRTLGVEQLVMLSGDHQAVVDSVAKDLGLDRAIGDMLPEDKVSRIEAMNREYTTALVGDGANDAPAMATAGVAIAMGAAGSDVALETADVALMGDDLGRLPFAWQLSRQTSKIIRQNLWISLGMIAVLVPVAMAGLNLATAVVFHEGSTVVVVLNALRLLGFREPVHKNVP